MQGRYHLANEGTEAGKVKTFPQSQTGEKYRCPYFFLKISLYNQVPLLMSRMFVFSPRFICQSSDP